MEPEEKEEAQEAPVTEPPEPGKANDPAESEATEGGGPKSEKETITREWHEKRLRKEAQRRERLAAENRKLRDEMRSFREREAKSKSASLLDDLGLSPEQKPMADVLGKLTSKLLASVDEKLGSHAERVKELSEEFHVERRRRAFRNLDDDQMELVEAIASENPSLRNPAELLALAKLRDKELFAGYEAETPLGEPSPARGSPAHRRGGDTIDDKIAGMQKQIDAAAKKGDQSLINTELGPKLMGLQRLKDRMMR